MNRHPSLRRLAVFTVVAALATVGLTVVGGPLQAQVVVKTKAGEVSAHVDGSAVLTLPFAARDIALHWSGHPDAVVTVATSTDGVRFGDAEDAGRDEVGEQRGNGETYGAILAADDAVAVQVTSDRPIGRLTVLALADGERVTKYVPGRPSVAGATVPQPTVLARSVWGADESLRFDQSGNEIWPTAFHPVQKLIVHHTAGRNGDRDPLRTIRSMFFYHAVTQGWGDIGYNFLIDESGRIFKGRHSHTTLQPSLASPSPDDTISGEDGAGNSVTAGHAFGFNSGTIGVALLGTLTHRDATSAARSSLEQVLAWKAEAHAIDPTGASTYTNPLNGAQLAFPNVAGHRDVNQTECPGGVFYDTLPSLRLAVAARIAGTTSSTSTTSTTRRKGPK